MHGRSSRLFKFFFIYLIWLLYAVMIIFFRVHCTYFEPPWYIPMYYFGPSILGRLFGLHLNVFIYIIAILPFLLCQAIVPTMFIYGIFGHHIEKKISLNGLFVVMLVSFIIMILFLDYYGLLYDEYPKHLSPFNLGFDEYIKNFFKKYFP